jgi:hypothetical protein
MLDALRRGDLAGSRHLRLPSGLTELPVEVFGLADTLEILEIGPGGLATLPADFGRLRRLRVLFCSGNRFDRLPPVLGDCTELSQIGCRDSEVREMPGEALPPRLRWLTLTGNRIETLPRAIGERPLLQKLMLAGNRLSDLPETLADAGRLELIRIAANRIGRLPPWLPRLPRLAWIAYAGNPCEPDRPVPAVADVAWDDLHPGRLLGEGASGRIMEADWHRDGAIRPVAVKLFKGAMTSDGLPEKEMAACLAAGDHPHLAGGLGRIIDHPERAQGLVMNLLPTGWRPLAGPPSLETCSRDVYDPGLALPVEVAVRLARATGRAILHLHGRDLIHGDLYAHNLLWDGMVGKAVLSDFGAASTLPAGSEGDALRRVETRAWGILLGELLDRCGEPATELRRLEAACTVEDAAGRPDMAEALDALDDAAAVGERGSASRTPSS